MRFLFVGRLESAKGVLPLLDAWTGIAAEAELTIVGDGSLRERVRERVAGGGMPPVRCSAISTARTSPRSIARADVFVFPSVSDPWGLVINEAMASGLPIVTTSAPGAVDDLVDPWDNGIVVAPFDVGALRDGDGGARAGPRAPACDGQAIGRAHPRADARGLGGRHARGCARFPRAHEDRLKCAESCGAATARAASGVRSSAGCTCGGCRTTSARFGGWPCMSRGGEGVRVLLTVPSLAREFGGPVGAARDLAEALRRAGGTQVQLVGTGESDEDGVTALGELARFHATPVPRRISPLRRLVRGADLVHVLSFRDPVGTLAAREARRAGVPYVLEPTGMFRRRLRSLWLKRVFDGTVGRTVLTGAAAVIATSDLEAVELRENGVPGERIRLRPNGVRFDGLLPLPARGAFRGIHGIPAEAPLVLAIARINAVKGLPVLVRAVVRIPGCHVAIAGPDEHDGTLKDLQTFHRSHELGEQAHILPKGVWDDGKREALADADVFCLPSEYESFGTAAAEAAGCGLPVVTTFGCGVAEWLEPEASRVVAPGDVAALSKALADVLGTRSFREEASASAARIRSELSWSHLALQQVEIYEEASRLS